VAPIWFLAQLTFNASLTKTSVTSNTILSSASALFTFGFAVVLLSERFTYLKLGFITMLMVGTAMVTISDVESTSAGEKASASVLGDALCLLSAVFYGMYTVSIRKQLKGDDETVPMTLFFAIMGSLIFLVIGSILAILFMSGVRFGTLSWSSLGIIILKGLLDNVLSDYLWARSILLLGASQIFHRLFASQYLSSDLLHGIPERYLIIFQCLCRTYFGDLWSCSPSSNCCNIRRYI